MNQRNNLIRLTLLSIAIAVSILAQSPEPPKQPLPFSHKLHVANGLKCQTCHVNPDPGEEMTFPATAKCMTCHTDVATDKPAIKELTKFHQDKVTIPWVRIYQNPDWVWFSHRTHLASGATCDRRHGAVVERDVLFKENPISMESCMNCHREMNASNACNFCHEAPH
jgi:Class III cytochrome C family/Cytochrome c7 and related cytochrome c